MTTTEPTPEAVADMDRLRDEVQRLRRWKTEASEVMIGLQDLGRALDIPLGKRITGTLAAEIASGLRAKVSRVEALADEWEADHGILTPDSRYTRDVLLHELRKALNPESGS